MTRDRRQALVRLLGELPDRWEEEVRERPLAAPPHTPAQLVELREAQLVRPIDDQGVRVRHVESGLDDRRADEDVGVAIPETDHLPFERVLVHLSVRHHDPGLGQLPLQPGGLPVDRRDAVVDPEHLAFAQELSTDRTEREPLVVAADVGEHRLPILGRRVDRGHLPDAGERHLERPGDRRRRHREDVDVRAEPLQALLVRHAEPLLLVDDQQAEVPERDVGAEQAVRADHHVHATGGHVRDDVLLLRRRQEPGEHRHLHRDRARTARRTSRSAAPRAASSAPGPRPACRPSPL